MTTIINIQCTDCKLYFSASNDDIGCKAFPKGIPDDIWFGRQDHTKSYPGDNGILFELKEKGPYFTDKYSHLNKL